MRKYIMFFLSSILLVVLSGCGTEIHLTKDEDGLPYAEELVEKSSEQIESLKSFSVESKHTYRNPSVKEADGSSYSTSKLDYVKEPFSMYEQHEMSDLEAQTKEYVTEQYGVSTFRNGQWELGPELEGYTSGLIESKKKYADPYYDLKSLTIQDMQVDQKDKNYILTVTGTQHEESSHEGYHDAKTGKEYTLIVTIDRKSKLTYTINKKTLLPVELIKETETTLDYSGDKKYSEVKVVHSYQDFNGVNEKKLLEGAYKASDPRFSEW
ncbi:hypothetical protein YSY43_43920 [Paenibacillus sp. YSY-4.3]